MLYIGIDLGTYLCRFIVANIARPKLANRHPISKEKAVKSCIYNKFNIITYQTYIVNFGFMEPGKPIKKSNIQRVERVFEKCANEIKKLEGPMQVRCVATAALRYSPQASEIIEQINNKFNIPIEIISSEHEVYLSALGCQDHIENEALVMDVGSGSTEIAHIVREGEKFILKDYISLDLGLVNNTTTKARREEAFDQIKTFVKQYQHLPVICAKCNTLKIAYNFLQNKRDKSVDGKHLSLTDLSRALKMFSRMDNSRLVRIPSVGSKKVRLIKSALPWVNAVLVNMGAESVILSEYGLKEGIVLDMISEKLATQQNYKNIAKNEKKETENKVFQKKKYGRKHNLRQKSVSLTMGRR